MKRLNYIALQENGYEGYLLKGAPERVLQFGEGNFLRAFVDYFIDIANEKTGFDAKVALVQPIAQGGLGDMFTAQQGLYTLYLRGREDGGSKTEKRVISAVSRLINPYEDYTALLDAAQNPDLRYIVSNTTEAGIVFDPACGYKDTPPASFPAKLTRFLHERWKKGGRGIVVLSCELIDNNGEELLRCVEQYCSLWELETGFTAWLQEECLFCSTLVDRIVTGYPRAEAEKLNAENGYEDTLLDTGELFALWVIQGPAWLAEELPFAKAGLPVKVVEDITPYKKQKVRILNGAHTSIVAASYMMGQRIVRDCMQDEDILAFMRRAIYEEIIPVLPLPKDELMAFADAVEQRFNNPYIDHELLSIALNSVSKWRARVLPTVKEYIAEKGALPSCLVFSLAALIRFYGMENSPAQDDAAILEYFAANPGVQALRNTELWGEDLSALPGLYEAVAAYLADMKELEVRGAMEKLLGE